MIFEGYIVDTRFIPTQFKGGVRRFFLFVQSFYRPKTKTCFNRQFSPPAEKRGAPAELVGGDELVGGEQEDTFMRSCTVVCHFYILMFPGGWIYSNVSRRLMV